METIKIGIGTSSIGRFLPYVGPRPDCFVSGTSLSKSSTSWTRKKSLRTSSAERLHRQPNAPSCLFWKSAATISLSSAAS